MIDFLRIYLAWRWPEGDCIVQTWRREPALQAWWGARTRCVSDFIWVFMRASKFEKYFDKKWNLIYLKLNKNPMPVRLRWLLRFVLVISTQEFIFFDFLIIIKYSIRSERVNLCRVCICLSTASFRALYWLRWVPVAPVRPWRCPYRQWSSRGTQVWQVIELYQAPLIWHTW